MNPVRPIGTLRLWQILTGRNVLMLRRKTQRLIARGMNTILLFLLKEEASD